MKIYWAARDLNSAFTPIGNHQFLVIEFDGRETLGGVKTLEENGRRFATLGATRDENGNLVYSGNETADVTSVREKFNPDERTSLMKPDFDLELHEVTPADMSVEELAALLIKMAQAFDRNATARPIPYDLANENCAAWVNTILKEAGLSEKERIALGEFTGVDWGEEDEIPADYFH